MTNEEVYDKFFMDEEFDLEDAPSDTYSYRGGWNNALKRASIVIRDEIRPHGKKECKQPYGWQYCSECGNVLEPQDKFCWFCGADLREDK